MSVVYQWCVDLREIHNLSKAASRFEICKPFYRLNRFFRVCKIQTNMSLF